MKKKVGVLLALVVVSLCIIVSSAKNNTDIEVEAIESTKLIEVVAVDKANHEKAVVASGNIIPAKTVKVAFKVPGVIERINFEEGDLVKKDDILAFLDSNQYKLNTLAAKSEYESLKLKVNSEIPSAINQAKSQLDLARQRYDSIKKLYDEGGISKDKFDEVNTTLVTIENKYNEALNAREIYAQKLKQAEAMTGLADTKLDDTTIKSPIDGVVMKKLFESGETIAEGYPVVVVGELGKVQAQIGVSDEVVNQIAIGDETRIFVYGVDKELTGKVVEIGALADTKTRTFPVKMEIDNENLELKPGMIAKVSIPLKSLNTILVPVDSVINMPEGPVVFAYNDKDNTVNQISVKTGRMVKDEIEILEGLKNGDQVVVSGQFMLRDKDSVKLGGSN